LYSNTLGRLSETFAHAGGIVIWLVGGSLVLRGQLTVGEIVAFNMLLGNLYGPIQRFAEVNVTIQNAVTNIERVFEVFDERPDVLEKKDARPMPDCRGIAEFDRVTYTYTVRNFIYEGGKSWG